MLIIPALDLKDGYVVRLVRGNFQEKKIYSRDPLKTARHLAGQGAELLHIVDLDGALSGRPKNLKLAVAIARAVAIPVEFGGGLREIKNVRSLLANGFNRVVLGTKAIEDNDFLQRCRSLFKDKVIISLDAQEHHLCTHGWQERGRQDIFSFADRIAKAGFPEIIYTDIAKDGTLSGPNFKNIRALLKKSGLKVIASGGVSSLEDIRRLKVLEKDGLSGVILGKALYEGCFSLKEALRIARKK